MLNLLIFFAITLVTIVLIVYVIKWRRERGDGLVRLRLNTQGPPVQTPQSQSGDTAPPDSPTITAQQQPPDEPPRKVWKFWLIIAAIVLAVILATIFLFSYGGILVSFREFVSRISSIAEIVLYLVMTLAIFPFFAYFLAKKDLFFTMVESGNIKFIDAGESLVKIIHDVQGKVLTGDFDNPMSLRLENGTERKTWFNRFGLYWIGIAPFHKVHSFKIKKEREKTNVPANSKPEEWIEVGKEETVTELRFTFPRPYLLIATELADNFSVDSLLVVKLEVVVPAIPVYIFKGRFFENTGGVIQSFVLDIIRGKTWDEFLAAPKAEQRIGAEPGILTKLKDPLGILNDQLEKQVGLRLVGISINQWDATDNEIKEAVRQLTLAEKKGRANIRTAELARDTELINADRDAKANIRRREGEKEAQNFLTEARGKRIRETVATLASSLGNPDIVARGAADILEMEAAASEPSKITTVLKSGGVSPVIPIGGSK